jgi:single-stranded-DNA-specific exonuclease
MLTSKTRWDVQSPDTEKVNKIAEALNIAPLVASLLVNRGLNTVEEAEAFLYPAKQSFHNPFLLDGMEQAVQRVHEAISKQEKILVFGDYDADGVSSTTVMVSALRELGASVDFYIPNRFTEGYGPNEAAFRWAKESGFSLIITVDTGIAAIKEASLAKELGIDLIITDHHEPGPILPDAYAIIHPKKPGSTYPFKELAGVGVAFKMAHALLGKVPMHLLDVAVIGTIADLVPLRGENRLIALLGLRELQTTKRVGLQALIKKCGIDANQLNEDTVGFMIGPRINAAGRLASADPAVHLLMTEDKEEAQMLAEEIDALNKERQQLVNEIAEEAVKMVEESFPPEENSVLVVAKEGWNSGIIGIVASRLVEIFYRPTIVLSIDSEKGLAKGSARSIPGFDLFANLSTCRDILPHFGGHPMAAGMTLSIEHIDELRTRLNSLAGELLTDEDFIPVTPVDVKCSIADISLKTIEQLQMLAPFGVDNPKPRVLIEDVSIQMLRRVGTDQSHLKAVFEQDGVTIDSIGFGYGYLYEEIAPNSKVSVVGELSINEWNNFRKPQLLIHDAAVREWQLFDIRGTRNIHSLLLSLPKEKRMLIAFHKETIDALPLYELKQEVCYIGSLESAKQMELKNKYVVLLDLPPSAEMIKVLLTSSLPERIYALFYQRENHFFSTMPTRDHFKWLYAFLMKRSPFDLARYGDELARSRGWTKETIRFMVQVFLELGFVTMENGIVTLTNNPSKRDLNESPTYCFKRAQFELENIFLYSSYQQLKRWFDEMKGSLNYEEAKV